MKFVARGVLWSARLEEGVARFPGGGACVWVLLRACSLLLSTLANAMHLSATHQPAVAGVCLAVVLLVGCYATEHSLPSAGRPLAKTQRDSLRTDCCCPCCIGFSSCELWIRFGTISPLSACADARSNAACPLDSRRFCPRMSMIVCVLSLSEKPQTCAVSLFFSLCNAGSAASVKTVFQSAALRSSVRPGSGGWRFCPRVHAALSVPYNGAEELRAVARVVELCGAGSASTSTHDGCQMHACRLAACLHDGERSFPRLAINWITVSLHEMLNSIAVSLAVDPCRAGSATGSLELEAQSPLQSPAFTHTGMDQFSVRAPCQVVDDCIAFDCSSQCTLTQSRVGGVLACSCTDIVAAPSRLRSKTADSYSSCSIRSAQQSIRMAAPVATF